MRASWLLGGVVASLALLVGGCPVPPAANSNGNVNANGNVNQNGSANTNANENPNANLNAGANENLNVNAGANENVNSVENSNQNASENTNANTGSNSNVNSSDNSNQNSSSNSNQNVNAPNLELQAVTDVTHGLAGFGAVVNAFGIVSDPLVNFDNLGGGGDLSNSSDPNPCPLGFYIRMGTVHNFEIDYGAGCATVDTNNETIAGKILISYTAANDQGAVTFSNLVINGQTITGTMTLTITGGGLSGQIAVAGTINVAPAPGRSVSGTFSGTITNAGRIKLSAVDATVVNGSTSYTLDLTDVEFDGPQEPNFAPAAGTVVIDAAGLQSTTVIYSATSPDTGVVSVSIGGGGAADFDVPGIGS